MARLQRKKKASAKKKKKKKTERAAALQVSNGSAAKQTAILAPSQRDVKKGQITGQRKALIKTRKEPGKLKSYFDTSVQFLREVKIELKKVTWPTRKQTMSSTVVVIILVMIISLFLGVIDIGLGKIIRVVLK
jgi:preprotein translocase subunit SecE